MMTILVYLAQCLEIGFLLILGSSRLPVSIFPARCLGKGVLTLLLVVGAIGLCGVPAWSRGQGWYLTVAVGSEQIHKTGVAGIRADPQWNETVQL